MNIKKSIKQILKEETSLQEKLNHLIKSKGIVLTTKSVGGFENLTKLLELDLSDIDTQEKLIKNFINFGQFPNVNVSFMEIRYPPSGNKVIDVHYVHEFNNPFWGETLNQIIKELNNFFPFKVGNATDPVFSNTGRPKIFIDVTPIDEEEDEEEYNDEEEYGDDDVIQESIRIILREETSLQLRVRDVIRTHGLKKAIKSIGGPKNLKKIFNNDLTIIYEELEPPYHYNLWEMGFDVDDQIEIFKLIFGDDIEIEGIDNGGDIYVYQEVGGNVGINRPYYEYFDGKHWEYKEFDENGYTNYIADSDGREVKLKHDDEGRQTYLEIPSTGEWEKWEYDDQGKTTRYETSWGTYRDFTREKNINESYRFKMRRVIHVIEDYIDNLNPNDICNYWTLSEEDDYVRQTMLELVRFVIDELNVESEYYTDVYDEIYGHVIDFGYRDKIRDFFIDTKKELCGGYNINESTNTSLQDKLLQMYNSKGIEFVIKAVNGVDNLRNIMGDKIEKFITEPYFKNLQYFNINPDEWNRILSNIFGGPVSYRFKKESSAFDSSYEVFDKETKNELYSEAFTSSYWVKYGYDVDNNRVYEESESGYIQKRKYNENKQLLRWEDNTGEWREWDYDENGNTTYLSSSKGTWTEYKYNEDGNMIWRESSDGSWCKWGYDENGDLDYYITDEGVKYNLK